MQVAIFEEVVAEERKLDKSLIMQPGTSEMERRESDPQGQIDEDLMEFFVGQSVSDEFIFPSNCLKLEYFSWRRRNFDVQEATAYQLY